MKKAELLAEVAKNTGLSKNDVDAVIKETINVITEAVSNQQLM